MCKSISITTAFPPGTPLTWKGFSEFLKWKKLGAFPPKGIRENISKMPHCKKNRM